MIIKTLTYTTNRYDGESLHKQLIYNIIILGSHSISGKNLLNPLCRNPLGNA